MIRIRSGWIYGPARIKMLHVIAFVIRRPAKVAVRIYGNKVAWGCIMGAGWLLGKVCIRKQEFKMERCSALRDMLESVGGRSLALGSVYVKHNVQFPATLVTFWPPRVILTSTQITKYSQTLVTTTAYGLWFAPELAVVGDDELSADRIMVLQNASRDEQSNDIRRIQQTICRSCIPAGAKARAQRASELMAGHFRAGNSAACVFVLYGEPGTGKSLSARMLAAELGGHLYPGYDPTDSKHNIIDLIDSYAECKPLVIQMDEADEPLSKIMNKEVQADSDVDAHGKASWNSLLDGLGNMVNVVLVMTTNKCKQGLLDQCKGDTSLLRAGRVTGYIHVPRDNDDVHLELLSTADVPLSWGSDDSDKDDVSYG